MPQWEKGKLLPLHELLSLTGYKSQTGKHHWFKISQQHLTTGLIWSWEYESFCSSLLLQNKPSPPFQQGSEHSISSKSTQWYSHPSFSVLFLHPPPPPPTGGYWLPSLQTCIDQYLFSEEYCANLKKLVYFVMGKKQSVNQTFGLSCQGSAVAKVQKYETAEIGQAGKKRDLCLQKWRQQSKRNGSIAVEVLPILRSPWRPATQLCFPCHIFSFAVAQQTRPLALQWQAIYGFTWSSEERDAFFSHMHSS